MDVISKQLASLALVAWSGCALAQNYTVTEIGSLGGSQGSFTNWGSVNDSGEVTGYSYIAGNQAYKAFIYTNGVMQDLGASSNSQSYGINDAGQVTGITGTCAFVTQNGSIEELNNLVGVCGSNAEASSTGTAINATGKVTGYSYAKGGFVHAVFYSDGKIKDLGTLGGNDSYGYGINGSGQVTGYATVASGANHAFITQNGALTDLGTLGGDSSVGYGINASGSVTGNSQIAGNAATHAFLYSKGAMKDLGGLGGTYSTGLAINSKGQVVGSATTASGASRAFLVSGGKLINLNLLIDPSSPLAPYVTLTSATGISNSGYIAANGTDSRYPGVSEVFLLTPFDALPTVTPKVTGTKSASGWYTSPTTLSWTVTGEPIPTTSGCGKISVPDTTGTTYTCTATNSIGTWSNSVTIEKDTVAPTVAVLKPTSGEILKLNQSVAASYTCSDATSGVVSCAGTVVNGANIPTSVAGANTFTVVATDTAGNTTTTSVSYTVK